MTKFLVFLSAILLLSQQAFAKEALRVLEGTVIKVSDGDTINVDSGGTKLKIRKCCNRYQDEQRIRWRTKTTCRP